MNRLGIRIAAGTVVACLGGLAVYQFRAGGTGLSQDEWPLAPAVAENLPPAPLGISAESGSYGDGLSPLDLGTSQGAASDAVDQGWLEAPPSAPYAAMHPLEMPAADSTEISPTPLPTLEQDSTAHELSSSNAGQPIRRVSFDSPLGLPPADDTTPSSEETTSPALPPPGFGLPPTLDQLPTADDVSANDLPVGSGVEQPVSPVEELSPLPSVSPLPAPLAEADELQPIEEPAPSMPPAGSNPLRSSIVLNPVTNGTSSELPPAVPDQAPPEPAPRLAMRNVASQPTLNLGADPTNIYGIEPNEVLSVPGEPKLEGDQTPSVVIKKVAPAQVRVGKPSEFILRVQNVGTVPALDVRVFDSVPDGTELVDTVPTAEQAAGLLVWQLGDLQPGEERSLTVRLIPREEGEIGSVARVTFEAAASVRTLATQPAVAVTQKAPSEVLIGQVVEIEILLTNTGSGTAENVIMQARLPEGLEHPMGKELDNRVGSMPPGDQRRQLLRLRATHPGSFQNVISLVDDDGELSQSVVDIQVVAPELEVALAGPSLRYLERQATYNVQIANTGTADASEIDLVAFLDKGLKFVSTEYEGRYDPNRHAVFWSLAELPAGESGAVPLTLLPVEAGTRSVRLEATADLGISVSSEKQLAIEALAELSFSIADTMDPIESGTETTYEIRVKNNGSKEDTNVRLEVQLPDPAMTLVSAEPQAGTDGRGRVVFQPLARLAPKGEQVFRVVVNGSIADTHLIKATLVSDQSRKPVTKEESTTVYADQ